MSHPVDGLDDTVHQRVRLGVMAVLNEAKRADFSYLRQALSLTDGNLSRHLAVLEEAGHVRIDKVFEGKKPRTWVAATTKGRRAFSAEIESLEALIHRARED